MSVSSVSAAGNAVKGAAIFQQCQDCHAAEKGINEEGSSLHGIIGRPAGNIADYAYSDAMKAAAAKGLTWTANMVVEYLANPHQFFVDYLGDPDARNKMVFMLANEQDREDIVTCLLCPCPPTDGATAQRPMTAIEAPVMASWLVS